MRQKHRLSVLCGSSFFFLQICIPYDSLNRPVDYVRIQSFVEAVAEDEVGVAVNPDGKGGYDLFLPLNNDILKAGNVTVENVTAALRGEKQEFFLNPDAVVDLINRANQQEYDNLKALREKISKMEQNLLGVIAENKQKAEAANKEWMNSAVQTGLDDVLNHTAAGIIVSQKTEQA